MKKSEYIKQLKRLIKKYHPDLCGDGQLELMYSEITKKLTNILNSLKIKEAGENNIDVKNCGSGLIKIKEQDYAYYKLGIRYYKKIHPNKFYKRNSDTTFETKEYGELVKALNDIFLSFNLAEYYFIKIIEEYPWSPWAADAKEKVKLLGKLHKSYENITLEEKKVANYGRFMGEMGLKMLYNMIQF